MVRSKARTALYPFAYVGVESNTPVQFAIQERDPNNDDFANWNIGAIWLNISTEEIWILVKKLGKVATWIMFAQEISGIHTLTGNNGVAVGPDAQRNITFSSSFGPFLIVGDGGLHRLSLTENGTIPTTFITDSMSATPDNSILLLSGGEGISTFASGNVVVVEVNGFVALDYVTNSGTASPENNILEIEGNGSTITTSGSTNIVVITGSTSFGSSFPTDSGTATPANGILRVIGGLNTNTFAENNRLEVRLNNPGGPGALVTNTLGVISSATGDDGQTLIGITGAAPQFNYISSSDGSVTFNFGPNSLDISASGAAINGGDNINIGPPDNTINLNETIHWPDTNGAGTSGVLYLGGSGGTGGDRYFHNRGSATTEEGNTFYGRLAGNFTLDDTAALRNTGIGTQSLNAIDTGADNAAVGMRTLLNSGTSSRNALLGRFAAIDTTTGEHHTIIGNDVCFNMDTGENNTGIGSESMEIIRDGSHNIYMTNAVTGGQTPGSSNNIVLGAVSTNSNNSKIWIGHTTHTDIYIAAIHGKTSASGTPVLINVPTQLGTVVSSRRHKEAITSLDDTISVENLRPVTFTYKEDETGEQQYGLIAESVYTSMPEIVVLDENLDPFSVQYDKLIPLLLHKIQITASRIRTLEKQLSCIANPEG